MKHVLLALATVALLPSSSLAEQMSNEQMADRLVIACPSAERLQFRYDRTGAYVTYNAAPKHRSRVEKCLDRAYAEIIKNPFPVNMTGYEAANAVRRENGKIVLYRK